MIVSPDYSNEPYEYRLDLAGPCFDHPGFVGEGITQGQHFFNTVSELWYFFAEVKILQSKHKAGFMRHEVREGRDVRFYTSARILLMHNFVTYEVRYDFPDAVAHTNAAFAFENMGLLSACDCARSALIKKFVPEFEVLECGRTVELISIKYEDLKYEAKQEK